MSEPTSSATGRSSPAPASSIVLPPGGWSNDRATSDGRVGLSGSADPGGPPAVAAITSDPSTGVACGTGPAEKMSELSTGGGASNRSAGRTSSGADVGAAGAPDGGPASSHPDAGATGGSRFPRSISEPSSGVGGTRIADAGSAVGTGSSPDRTTELGGPSIGSVAGSSSSSGERALSAGRGALSPESFAGGVGGT